MENIFVASSFHDYDRALVNDIGGVVEALGLRPVNGRDMGGEALEDSIRRRIEECDGLVALFTKRQASPIYAWENNISSVLNRRYQ